MSFPLATSVAVPAVIFAGGLIAGVFAASRLLPELPEGLVAGIAFFVVCVSSARRSRSWGCTSS